MKMRKIDDINCQFIISIPQNRFCQNSVDILCGILYLVRSFFNETIDAITA